MRWVGVVVAAAAGRRGSDDRRRRDDAQARPARRGDPARRLGAAGRSCCCSPAGSPTATIVVQTDRLHALSMSLRDMSYRKLSAVLGENMPAEMSPLIEALNALIAKLDAAALAHRTFIANAAHQLRTPLTALSLQAEQALRAAASTTCATPCAAAVVGAARDAARQSAAAAVARGARGAVGRQPPPHRPVRARVRDGARVGAGGDGRGHRPRLRRVVGACGRRRRRRAGRARRSTTCSTTR